MNETGFVPNVYDFDKTVVYPDGGAAFLLFCMRRHPALLRYLPGVIVELIRFAIKHNRDAPFKAEYYRYLRGVKDLPAEVRLFWETKGKTLVKPWCLAQLRPGDVIITCSASFFLQPWCDPLGLRLVSTHVDTKTGKLESYSCYGKEKVRRLREALGDDIEIGEFYSDSLSDAPLAAMAQKAFLVKGDDCRPWPAAGEDNA